MRRAIGVLQDARVFTDGAAVFACLAAEPSRWSRSPRPTGSQAKSAASPKVRSQGRPGLPVYPSRPGRGSREQGPRTRGLAVAAPNTKVIAALLTVLTWTALSGVSVAQSPWTQYSCRKAIISYELPSTWQVEKQATLEKARYLSYPYPTYALLAGAEPAKLDSVPNPPSIYAFSETPSPWFTVLVVTGKSAAPSPEDAYELAPEGEMTLQREQGLHPTELSLTKPVQVSSGGLRGSQDRSEVIVPGAGDMELDEVAYTKGETVWMTMAGCTLACYNANAVTLTRIIDSVKVGEVFR